jgi:hypothetical protein
LAVGKNSSGKYRIALMPKTPEEMEVGSYVIFTDRTMQIRVGKIANIYYVNNQGKVVVMVGDKRYYTFLSGCVPISEERFILWVLKND